MGPTWAQVDEGAMIRFLPESEEIQQRMREAATLWCKWAEAEGAGELVSESKLNRYLYWFWHQGAKYCRFHPAGRLVFSVTERLKWVQQQQRWSSRR
jgi:hypothetical protein